MKPFYFLRSYIQCHNILYYYWWNVISVVFNLTLIGYLSRIKSAAMVEDLSPRNTSCPHHKSYCLNAYQHISPCKIFSPTLELISLLSIPNCVAAGQTSMQYNNSFSSHVNHCIYTLNCSTPKPILLNVTFTITKSV